MPGVGLVMTVKDEEALLRKNLLFHRYLGVSRFYVFDDRSSDGTVASVAGLAGVSVRPSAAPAELLDRVLAERLGPFAATQHWTRQILNASLAAELAREDGLDWLVHVDADELVCPNLERVDPDQLAALLAAQRSGVDAVRFPALEIVQRRLDDERPFEEAVLFKRAPEAFERTLVDPRSGARVEIRGFYGHSYGKSAVRVGARFRPESMHVFVGLDGRPLRTAVAGYLLHYHLYSFENFLRARRRTGIEPEHHPTGRALPAHKILFRELASDPRFSDAELRAYFERWLLVSDQELARLAAPRLLGLFPRKAKIVEVRAVRQALARLDTGGQPGDNT